jgi:mannose-1-phosphate guanylyltransferase
MSNLTNRYAVIMAGGVGTRFWPMSRVSKPKQFLDILGTGKSLIQMTFSRLALSIPTENILVVTNEIYRSEVSNHLPDILAENVLCEPCMRNTAPCIAYANSVISSRVSESGDNPSETAIIVAPSDHLILDESEFSRILDLAAATAISSPSLVTIGITPTRPDTGYGYIKYSGSGGVASVDQFTEKPDLATAEKFIEAGGYCWNSGIFVWSLSNITAAFKAHLPTMADSFESANLTGTAGEVDGIYEFCESISIDYGILEKCSDVSVIPADFGWSDLGTWTSLAQHLPSDKDCNSTSGIQLIASESKGNVMVGGSEKVIAIKGLNDFIVVDTEDALLICPKSEEQWVKTLVGELKGKK